MKKTILALSSVLMAITALAQFPATSNRAYFTISKTEWQQVTGFTDGVVNDSIRGIEIAGVKYQRIDLNSTAFNAQSVGIRADGTDQTLRLNAVLAKSYVKELVMDIAGGGAVTVNGTVNFTGKKVTFKNTYLTGAGTVSNLYYSAGDYDRVFDTTLHFSGLKSSAGYITPKQFGAAGDGITNDYNAVRKTFTMPNVKIRFTQDTFRVTGNLVLDYRSVLDMPDGSLIVSATTGAGVMIGTLTKTSATNAALNRKEYTIRIARATQSDWTDTTSIGVVAYNLDNCIIRTPIVSGFTVGLKTIGRNGGFAYNTIYPGHMLNNERDIYIATENAGSTSWNNENYIIGGRYARNASVNSGKRCYGIVFGNEDYPVGNNQVLFGSIEKGAACIPFSFVSAKRNNIRLTRAEGCSDTVALVLRELGSIPQNFNNDIYMGRSVKTDKMIDLSINRQNLLGSADKNNVERAYYTVVAEDKNIGAKAMYLADSSVQLAGPSLLLDRSGTALTPVKSLPGVKFDDDVVYMAGDTRAAVVTDQIDASKLKNFVVQFDLDGRTTTSSVLIKPYDRYGRIIDNNGTIVGIGETNTISYSTTFGGAFIINSLGNFSLSLEDTVKSVIVGFAKTTTGGSSFFGIRSYKITSYAEGSPLTYNTYTGKSNRNKSPVAPSIGSFELGDIIENSNPVKDSVWAWVCTASGTFGSLSGVTATTANGSLFAVLNTGSGAKVKVGEYVNLSNNPIMISGIKDDTIFLRSRTYGSLSNASINYAVPSFEPIARVGGNGPGGGGSGSVTLSGDLSGTGTGTVPATVNNNAITYAKIQNALGLSVIGRSANSTGVVDAITAAADGNILYRNATALVFGKPDLVTSIRTALSGYVKAGSNTFSASASVPYSDISGVPNVFFKNSSSTGDSLLYLLGDTLAIKRVEVTAGNSIISTPTATLGKLLYNIGLQGDVASPGNNKLYGTNGSGVRGWYDQPAGGEGGGVSSVALQLGSTGSDANVTGSPVTSSGTFILNLPTASAAARGLLSSANWTTFNNKADGARTLTINGTTYNLTANRTWDVGTVTSVGLALTSTGNNVSVSGTVSTSGNLTINIPTASSTVRGVLSTADWIAFNAKAANTVNMIAGAGLQGGGTLSANRTFSLGTPSDITSTSVNSASGTTHTHALNNTGVAAGTYTNPVIAVDAKGRITSASNGTGIGNGNLANMPGMTIKGNNTASPIAPKDLAVWEVREMLKIYDGNYVPALTTNPDFAMVEQDDTLRLFNTYSGSLANDRMNNTPLASLTIVYPFYYTRIGDNVHVWGRIKAFTDNTDGFTAKTVNIALPFSTTTTQRGDLYGICRITKVADGSLQVVEVTPSTGGTQANISFIKAASTQEEFEILMTFDYSIK